MDNLLALKINSFSTSNIILFFKYFFYKSVFTRFILFRNLLLFIHYNVIPKRPILYFSPRHTKKFTVLRSPHVHKKSRDQYEVETNTANLLFYDVLNVVYYASYLSLKKFALSILFYKDCSSFFASFNNYLIKC